MTLGKFSFTDRARPVVEIGVGDTRIPVGSAVWDTARWDDAAHTWAGTEPTWFDITCDTYSYRCEMGRPKVTERFVAGAATVLVNNETGWADPNETPDLAVLTVRPGRAIRMGVVHKTFGVRWLFRGFIDNVVPVYDPTQVDTVQFDCVDALGEVNRAKFVPQELAPAGETVNARIDRLLTLGKWPDTKRDLQPTSDTLVADDMAGQLADLLSQAADSNGGVVFGDHEARIAYRPRDWQTYQPGTPVDGTIGNVDQGSETGPNRVTFGEYNYLWFGDQVIEGVGVATTGDVCPTRWERPFARADITTRVIVGREGDDTSQIQLDDVDGQVMYGIEPFERTDLLTESSDLLQLLARRYLVTRNHTTAPRVRSVSLDARTADNALDLMATVDVYDPSRYRCRLQYPRGLVFDEEYFATAVVHEVTPNGWTLELNLDSAAPFALVGERWDAAHWDSTVWANPVLDPQEDAA